MKIQKLNPGNIKNIVSWCRDKDADFLYQWAGAGYEYPLTEGQIEKRLSEGAEIYEVVLDGRMVGTIEIIARQEEAVALAGRFVLDPALTGQGLGSRAMETFLDHCARELGLKKIRLFVFDFNTAAYKCYRKCGFSEVGTELRPNGWKAIGMERIIGQ